MRSISFSLNQPLHWGLLSKRWIIDNHAKPSLAPVQWSFQHKAVAAVYPIRRELFLPRRLDLPTWYAIFQRTWRQDRRVRAAFTRRQIAPEHQAALIVRGRTQCVGWRNIGRTARQRGHGSHGQHRAERYPNCTRSAFKQILHAELPVISTKYLV